MNTSSDDIQPAANAQPACRNCGAPMLGAHCYACGQPVKGLVRPLGDLFGDLLDSVFNVDTRILRTLPPLVFVAAAGIASQFAPAARCAT